MIENQSRCTEVKGARFHYLMEQSGGDARRPRQHERPPCLGPRAVGAYP